MKKGKFIVFQGLDRCGKSTMVNLLTERQSQKCVKITYPNRQTAIGKMINQFLLNKQQISHQAVHLLFSANRWQTMEQVSKILQSGKNIICDRYWYSGVAYSYAKGLDFQWCISADIGLIQPDLVVILKGTPQKLALRQGYGQQRYQRVQFQTKVGQAFQKLSGHLKKQYIKIINIDDKTLANVKQQVFSIVDQILKKQS